MAVYETKRIDWADVDLNFKPSLVFVTLFH